MLSLVLANLLLPGVAALGGQQCLWLDTDADSDDHFQLANHGALVPLVTDSSDPAALHIATSTFADDLERVTGVRPEVFNDTAPSWADRVIMVGTASSPLVSSGNGAGAVAGQWEAYDVRVLSSPMDGLQEALVITGSDKRGAIYGLYELSEQMGVSPWYWWADVPTSHHDIIAFPRSLVCDHGEPTVKYRGIFINDENPVLSSWSHDYFGIPKSDPPFQVGMYEQVFEVLLRLKGNYFWPAMWASMFDVDGLDVSNGLPSDPVAGPNQVLADRMGIVMGTSHQEPMARNTPEWQNFGEGDWNFTANTDFLHDFWVYGAERAKGHETMFTVGMRGNGDLPLPGANIPIMENITAVQQDILRMVYETDDISAIPQVWAMYKEVMGYFADGMSVPDDVISLLAEDNWGNLVAVLPWGDNHTAGGGIYYHADYVGDPRSYKWINTVPLAKMWEQMDIARRFETTELWILNVGDLKILEIPIEWYLSLAYDSDRWPRNSLASYLAEWGRRDFSLSEEESWELAEIMGHYQMMVSRRKPEQVDSGTFSNANYEEGDRIVQSWKDLEYRSKCIYDKLSSDTQISYFQLVHSAIALNANLNELYVSASKSNLYATQALSSANLHAQKALDCFDRDWELTHEFHTLLDGKWNHMLAQTHLNYQYWQQPMRNSMPQISFVTPHDASYPNELAYMRVTAENYKGAWPGDNEFNCEVGYGCSDPVMLPMDPYGNKRWFEVGSGGPKDITFTATSNESWLTVSPTEGWIKGDGSTDTRCYITINWDAFPDIASAIGSISVNGSDGSVVAVTVPVNNTARPPADFHGFVEGDGYVVMEAGHYTGNTSATADDQPYQWEEIDYYGRTYSGMAMYPISPQNFTAGEGPSLSYDFWSVDSMVNNTVNVTLQIGPSLNFMLGSFLSFAVGLDDQPVQSINPVPYAPLGSQPDDWEWVVANEVRNVTLTMDLAEPGHHTLKVYGMTIGVVLQRIWIDMGGISSRGYSYLGPPESKRV